MRGGDIFNVYTDTLSHYNSPTRPQSDCVSCSNDLRGGEGELLFLIRFLIVLFSVFARILLSGEFLFTLWITFLPYFSFIIFFSPYMNIALIQTPTCSRHDCPFNAMKYISCKARTSFICNKSFAPSSYQ